MTGEKNIEKKLGVWGIDEVVGNDDKLHASDYYCIDCYKKRKKIPAEAFWPMIDPDIPYAPYCRPCIDRNNMKIIMS